jgi:Amidase
MRRPRGQCKPPVDTNMFLAPAAHPSRTLLSSEVGAVNPGEAERASRPGTGQVRTGDQPQDRQSRFLADANELCRFGALARAEQVQERFNAFSLIDADAASADSEGATARWRSGAPLSGIDGVPTTIKDIVWVKDWAVRYGSRTTSAAPCTQDASKNCRPARDRRFQHQHSGNSRSVLFKNPCRTIRLLIRSLCRAVGRRF